MRWEPLAAMGAVMALGVWLVLGPRAKPGLPETRGGARLVELRIGDDRGALEIVDDASGRSYRFLFRDGTHGPLLPEDHLRAVLSPDVFERLNAPRTNWLFRVFNITSWGSMAWIAVGLGGQLVFSLRFLVQWLVSERRKQSVIPEVFWWFSMLGGLCLFFYFGWRQDIVGVLGQSSGVVIYARNIRLIHKRGRREREAGGKAPAIERADTLDGGFSGKEASDHPATEGRERGPAGG